VCRSECAREYKFIVFFSRSDVVIVLDKCSLVADAAAAASDNQGKSGFCRIARSFNLISEVPYLLFEN
jgi:hypothetical protein